MKVLVTGGTNGMGKGVAKILAGIDNQIHEVKNRTFAVHGANLPSTPPTVFSFIF